MLDEEIEKRKHEINVQIGQRIQKVRSEADISQTELGAAIGVGGSQMSRYELGEAACAAWQLEIIADELGVTVDYLMHGQTEDTEIIEMAKKIKKLPMQSRMFIQFGIEGQIKQCI